MPNSPQLSIELVLDCGEPPSAEALVASLREVIDAIDTGPPGMVTSLSGRLARAEAAIVAGDTSKACSNLQAFRNQAGALQEKFLSGVTSAEVIATATEAMGLLGCR